MSGIDKLASSLKKKMTLNDYTPQKSIEVNTAELSKVNGSSLHKKKPYTESECQDSLKSKPIKTTIYLKPSSKRHFDEIYAKRILGGNKTDMSELLSEAIDILYERECAKHNLA